MSDAIAKTAQQAGTTAVQRCILPGCAAQFGIREQIYVCPRCGGPLEIEIPLELLKSVPDLRERWQARAASHDPRDRSGVWRFRELLPFDNDAPVVTLFEGNTPLYDAPRSAKYAGLTALRLKHQGCNPTASFKDTGMTTAVTQAKLLGARTVVCASTGNTAASLAAYAARAELQCAILLPQGQISPAKLAQSMDYGAVVCEIAGNFDDCMRLISELADVPSIYIANSINPFRIEGQKTVAFELLEQCGWRVPDHVVVPGGNMGNSSALGKGFDEMLRLGLIDRLPKISVIQAEGSAPLAHLFAGLKPYEIAADAALPDEIAPVANPRTLATAIKIGAPVSWKKALRTGNRRRQSHHRPRWHRLRTRICHHGSGHPHAHRRKQNSRGRIRSRGPDRPRSERSRLREPVSPRHAFVRIRHRARYAEDRADFGGISQRAGKSCRQQGSNSQKSGEPPLEQGIRS
jgi:threonine synthase